jgi:ParB family transcriptional regulator, chromosome partitioning protein
MSTTNKPKQVPLSPLQAMMLQAKSVPDIANGLPVKPNDTVVPQNTQHQIIAVSPKDICRWQYKDRPELELGAITELATDMKLNGQIQPAIVRLNKSGSSETYELLIGERRWRAALLGDIALKVIVAELSDKEAAIQQASENENRQDISDYAKSLSYKRLIENKIITAKDLETQLNKSQSYVRNILSFSRLDPRLVEAIGDLTNVSARTAYELVLWQERGEHYLATLITLAPRIRLGKMGAKQLEAMMKTARESINAPSSAAHQEIITPDGRHIFTWRSDSNGNKIISFPKAIRSKINFAELQQAVTNNIQDQLLNLIESNQKA